MIKTPKLKKSSRIAKPSSNGEHKLIRLDLGCGKRFAFHEGFIGVDANKACKPDVVWDLTVTPWPWESDSVDEVVSVHFLEHLTGPERNIFMNELWRVLKLGAKAKFQVPYYSSQRAIQDWTHQWPPLSERSFLYFNRGWREANKLDHYETKCNFGYTYYYILEGETAQRAVEVQCKWAKQYLNAVDDLIVTLEKEA